MTLLYLTLGAWRAWLGGTIGKDWPILSGLTWLQYAALIALCTVASWGEPAVAAINTVAILVLARGYGHGPMLRYPLGDDKDGDFILDAVGGPGGGNVRWFSYAAIRYMVPAVLWSGALALAGVGFFAAPLVGAGAIIIAYRFSTLAVAETAGWTALGAALCYALI